MIDVRTILDKSLYTVEPWDSHHPGSYTHTCVDMTPVKEFLGKQQDLITLYKKLVSATKRKEMYKHRSNFYLDAMGEYKKRYRYALAQVKKLQALIKTLEKDLYEIQTT